MSNVRVVEHACLETYKDSGKGPRNQNSGENIPLGGGLEVGCGAYGRQSSGLTFHNGHSGPLGIESHVAPSRSAQQVALGDDCYECGKVGHYVRDCHKAPVQLARGGSQFVKGKQGKSSCSSCQASRYRCCYDCGGLD
ncbi:hypothetical protein H5410_022741 [Solanum commersonii]|uniref:CCHC-type domain-containing protein n=1 Tax=Solanum commersonii TaxID=4109 RepID=A0A9J5ZIK4_SOLCO|nr:hypothetical protein H5410_022741 [Solanum commersonii]